MAKTLAERLAAGIDKRGPDECWEWQRCRFKRPRGPGYGAIGARNAEGERKLLGTHRVAWALANGPIPDGMCVLHHCDNPPCCNPAHLYAGTPADNMRDRKVRGREGQLGPKRHPEKWLAVMADRAAGMRVVDIAKKHGVCENSVYDAPNVLRRWGVIA